VLIDAAHRNAFHPVLDYLGGLSWDGVKRIDKWLTTYGKVEENEYTRAVGRIALVAAVRRVRQPGCKFDEMLVLVDEEQGTEKSEAIQGLCPNPDWFTDSFRLGSNDKETIETLYGKWIAEIPELAGMRRSEVETIKAQLSRQRDRARLAYGRFRTEARRQCIFFGTTNELQFLKDNQNRRFWPVQSGRWDVAALQSDRNQLWAEAAAAEAAGESIRLAPSLWGMAGSAQEQHEVVDPWLYTIEGHLGDKTGRIRSSHVFDLLMLPEGTKRPDMGARLHACMRKLGWDNNSGKVIKFPAQGDQKEEVKRGYMCGNEEERKWVITVGINYDEYGNRRLYIDVLTPDDVKKSPPTIPTAASTMETTLLYSDSDDIPFPPLQR
jgi:predicted P-loop ATPase